MKTRNLFLALTLPAAFAACSNEEFMDNNAVPSKDNLVELGEGFVLAGQGTSGASTRGNWEQNLTWSWLPAIKTTAGNSKLGALDADADRIGLCWTGELPDGTGNAGSMVYTNYEFLHDGWLAKGEEAAKFEECSPFALLNGKNYKGIDVGSLSGASTSAEVKTQLAASANQVDIDGIDKELNLNTGIFKTSNKAIFGGSYIVYYPYNEKFADATSLPATSPVAYSVASTGDVTAKYVAENTFMVGYARNLIGGSEASKFGVNPLSAIISLQLKQTGAAKTINKVALWSKDGFVTSVGLDASKIKSLGADGGEALYVAGTKKTASTIVASLATPEALTADTYVKIYLPILPTTTKDLKAIVYATDKSIAVVSLNNDYTFAAADAKSVKVDLAVANFKSDALVAVDEASLNAAVTGTYANPVNVTVIGDIKIDSDLKINDKVTVDGGKIIVPEKVTLTVDAGATIKSTVEVQGETCCGGTSGAGKMVVNGNATIAGNVNVLAGYKTNLDGQIEFNGTAAAPSMVVATSTIVSDGTIDFKGVTDIRGTLTLNTGGVATLSDDASDVNVKGGTVNNNGTFTVEKGKFAMLDAAGQTVAAAGKNFKNNGVFIDNIGTTIGGATQYMTFGANGDYICKVNVQTRLDEAYTNKAACSTIQFVNTATAIYDLKNATKHNEKYINVVDNGTATEITNSGTVATTIGNLTVMDTRTLVVLASSKPISVSGDIVLDGTFTTNKDVQDMTANNMIVNDGGAATFGNRETKLGVTLAVANTIEVKKNGTFTMTTAAVGANVADVTCKKLIEGGTFNGKPRVIE